MEHKNRVYFTNYPSQVAMYHTKYWNYRDFAFTFEVLIFCKILQIFKYTFWIVA